MAGLLEMLGVSSGDPAKDNALNQGLLSFGLNLMANKRGNLAGALGEAGLAGLGTANQGLLQARNQGIQDKQMAFEQWQQQRAKDEAARADKVRGLASQYFQPPAEVPGPQPEGVTAPLMGAPKEDTAGYLSALKSVDFPAWLSTAQALSKPTSKFSTTPQTDQNGRLFVTDEQGNVKYLSGVNDQPLAARDKPENVNGVWVNPYTTQPQGVAPQNPNQPFVYGSDGKMKANQAYQQYALSNSKAGASQTSIKIDNKLGEGLAKEVGPMVKESYDSARGAQQAITTADSIIKAVDSNKVFAGPGATFKLKGAQIAQVLGIGGTDDAEKIANTRAAIQGLAQSTLASRASLKGQGAVSDFEGKLIERAASGEIGDLTQSEIKQIAVVNKRLAKQQLSNHSQFIGKLKQNDTTSGIANMFELPTQDSGVVDFGSLR